MLLHSSSHNRTLLNEEEKPVFLTSHSLDFAVSDDSLEKHHSTTEKLRRDLLIMKQSSFNTNDKAPSPSSRVMEVLRYALRCVDKKGDNYDDEESFDDDYDDELRDSIHLAKRRLGRPQDSEASWPATKLRGDFNASVDSCTIPNLEPDSRSKLRTETASVAPK